MNFPEAIINESHHWRPFYRNSYMCKPAVLLKMISYMTSAMDIAETNSAVKALISQDSGYTMFKGQEGLQVAQRIFGKDYYEYHPFIFERLPTFFSNYLNSTLLFIDEPLQPNPKYVPGEKVEVVYLFEYYNATILRQSIPEWIYSVRWDDDGVKVDVNVMWIRKLPQ